MAITPFSVIQAHCFLYQSKVHTSLYLLSCTVSKLWPIIGQIFATEKGSLHFNALAGAMIS